ncbi:conserved hypothetical protein [Candidatus Ruthia magnifica str. Cm (Calyptogena magnifica)]|uniref:Tagatose-6-phosphate kinase n=1 Tax=Ruthia magnifica subsp. Calyptogena magnifica TaxID=413404 RepID=A1AXF6_RUTMC|nr:hypothetical protein [Candidatus Ruthturnera calyptogenae]ABL02613.1 conserved hypothetical protein [Candidatus Ruthia magnifica str. Cm (Calyptogena magnifica)]
MIKDFLKNKKATLLCSGPMSKNCIDASIELSKQFNIPQILIASRRQIDSKEFGGGYVENFTTEKFVNYVKNKNANKIFLARDHGGLWQGISEIENNLNILDSMISAKKSLENDILAEFNFLHLDPSIPIQGENLTIDKILNRLFELYGHTFEFAKQNNKNIQFELGTEEQDGYGQSLEQFEYFLNETQKFYKKNKITKPTFVVAQTGTKVMECKNVGIFKDDIITTSNLSLEHLKQTVFLCKKYDVMLKEHNVDYLSNEALSLRPILGIRASNVAPEFGVVETKGFLYLLNTFGYKKEFDLFVNIAVSSNKWKKWILEDSKTTAIDKTIICGHYIFSNEQIIEMKQKVVSGLLRKNINLDEYLKTLIKQSMTRYIQLFKMI